jgi:type IV secretion system protein VirD4
MAKILINNDEDAGLRGSFVSIALKHNNFSEVMSELRDMPESIIKNKLFKYLEIFLNPFVKDATSTSDFDISKFHEEKSTLYVKLEPSEVNYLQPLMSFFYQFALTQLNKNKTPKKPETGGVALILDEFATLGKMDLFINAISYCRGYHVRLCLLVQNIEQLKRIYGDATNELVYNSSGKIFFATESEETRKLAIQVSKNQLKEEQILSLEKTQEVILIENEKLVIANKIKYYEESDFKI